MKFNVTFEQAVMDGKKKRKVERTMCIVASSADEARAWADAQLSNDYLPSGKVVNIVEAK